MEIALIGYGKMGKTIEKLALAAGHTIKYKYDNDNIDDLFGNGLQGADVAIEFSRPEAAFENLKACIDQQIPVVSGTTGWLDQRAGLEALVAEKQGAFFYASNFSIGVNIFFRINQLLAQLADSYPEYEVKMEEIHHTQKLDAPSGTAIRLAEDIISNVKRKKSWNNAATDKKEEIEILSRRLPEVPGTHTVSLTSPIDRILITHEAFSREGFAQGALRAAEWLPGKSGCFGMEDMLGFQA